MISLQKSDVVAMMVSVAYESRGLKIPSWQKGMEKVAYQVIGRYIADNETIKSYVPEAFNVKDASAGLVAAVDEMARKRSSMKSAAMAGVQEGLSSFLGRKGLEMAGMDDGALVGGQ